MLHRLAIEGHGCAPSIIDLWVLRHGKDAQRQRQVLERLRWDCSLAARAGLRQQNAIMRGMPFHYKNALYTVTAERTKTQPLIHMCCW